MADLYGRLDADVPIKFGMTPEKWVARDREWLLPKATLIVCTLANPTRLPSKYRHLDKKIAKKTLYALGTLNLTAPGPGNGSDYVRWEEFPPMFLAEKATTQDEVAGAQLVWTSFLQECGVWVDERLTSLANHAYRTTAGKNYRKWCRWRGHLYKVNILDRMPELQGLANFEVNEDAAG